MNDPYVLVSVNEVRALLNLADDASAAGLSIDPAAVFALRALVDRANAGHYYDPISMQFEYTYEYWEETVEYWETTTVIEQRPSWGVGLGRALWRMIR